MIGDCIFYILLEIKWILVVDIFIIHRMALAPDVMRFMMGMASLIPLSFPLRYMNKHFKYWYSLILSFAL